MENIHLQVSERTKAGKLLLAFIEMISKEKGVKIIEPAKKTKRKKEYPISKNIPNAETERIMKENDKNGTKGLKKFDTVDALFEDLGI